MGGLLRQAARMFFGGVNAVKKAFWFRLVSLAAFVMLLAFSCAMAEEAACPVQAPSAAGTFATQWQLFSGEAVEYRLTLQVEEETGLRTYTIQNPAEWGIPASVCGIWQYEPETGWAQTTAQGQQVQLLLDAASYEQNGFPHWTSPCNGADSLTLTAYLGQVRHLYAYVDYHFGDDEVSVYAKDGSFTLSQTQPVENGVISTYASYDPYGVLAYASYSMAGDDGSLTTWRIEAVPQQQRYVLAEVYHADAEEKLLFWVNGQWQDEGFEPVDAPEGISTDAPPFAVVGGWVGIPFEEPGDKPEGTFPAGSMPTDPSLAAADYHPWPEETDALYLRWVDAGLTPVMPAASWATLEDGAVAFTVTGLEKWGVQENHMGDWCWNAVFNQWERGDETTPGQMTLVIPANQPADSLTWAQPTANEGEDLHLYLSRKGLVVEIQLADVDGNYLLMDNQGGLTFVRFLDENRYVQAVYDQYTLLDYSIHTTDDAGNLLTMATYSSDDSKDASAFELACFFVYSTQTNYEEYLWLRDVGWYSYATGEPCDCPEGVQLEECTGLRVEH